MNANSNLMNAKIKESKYQNDRGNNEHNIALLDTKMTKEKMNTTLHYLIQSNKNACIFTQKA